MTARFAAAMNAGVTPCRSCCGPESPAPSDSDIVEAMTLTHLAQLTENHAPADPLQLAALGFTQRQIDAWSAAALEAARAQLAEETT